MAATELKITGMHCDHCLSTVRGALEGVRGVRKAEVDLEDGRAIVDYDPEEASVGEMVGAVMDEGYTAERAA